MFQSPLGETPCSGLLEEGKPEEGEDVSIPTRGNTLFRHWRWDAAQRARPGFNPHSGKHPVPGDCEAGIARCLWEGFNPHSGKHPVPGTCLSIACVGFPVSFNPHSGKHPVPGCSVPSDLDSELEFQSPRGETPCSGLTSSGSKSQTPGAGRSQRSFNPHSGKHPVPGNRMMETNKHGEFVFQSPLGETPCSGLVGFALVSGMAHVSIPTRGNILFRGPVAPRPSPARSPSFNPHSGKHPGPRVRGVGDLSHPPRVSIPTRGNTLFRGSPDLRGEVF